MPKLDPSARWDMVFALAAVIAFFLGLGMLLRALLGGHSYPIVTPRVEGPPLVEQVLKDAETLPKAQSHTEAAKTETPKPEKTDLDPGPRGIPANPDKGARENSDPRPHGHGATKSGAGVVQRPRHNANHKVGQRPPYADAWCPSAGVIDVDKITGKTNG